MSRYQRTSAKAEERKESRSRSPSRERKSRARVTNDEIADYLHKVALRWLAQSNFNDSDASAFSTYATASRAVRDSKSDVSRMDQDELEKIRGIAGKISNVIIKFVENKPEPDNLRKLGTKLPRESHMNDRLVRALEDEAKDNAKSRNTLLNAADLLRYYPKKIESGFDAQANIRGIGDVSRKAINEILGTSSGTSSAKTSAKTTKPDNTREAVAEYLDKIGKGFGFLDNEEKAKRYGDAAKEMKNYKLDLVKSRDDVKRFSTISNSSVLSDIQDYLDSKDPHSSIRPALEAYEKNKPTTMRKSIRAEDTSKDKIINLLTDASEGFKKLGKDEDYKYYSEALDLIKKYGYGIKKMDDVEDAGVKDKTVLNDIEDLLEGKKPHPDLQQALDAGKKVEEKKEKKKVESKKEALVKFLGKIAGGLRAMGKNGDDYIEAVDKLEKSKDEINSFRDFQRLVGRDYDEYVLDDVEDFFKGVPPSDELKAILEAAEKVVEKGKEEKGKEEGKEKEKGEERIIEKVVEVEREIKESDIVDYLSKLSDEELSELRRKVPALQPKEEERRGEEKYSFENTPELSKETKEEVKDITSFFEVLKLNIDPEEKILLYWTNDLQKPITDKDLNEVREVFGELNVPFIKEPEEKKGFIRVEVNNAEEAYKLLKPFNRGVIFNYRKPDGEDEPEAKPEELGEPEYSFIFQAYPHSTARVLFIREPERA